LKPCKRGGKSGPEIVDTVSFRLAPEKVKDIAAPGDGKAGMIFVRKKSCLPTVFVPGLYREPTGLVPWVIPGHTRGHESRIGNVVEPLFCDLFKDPAFEIPPTSRPSLNDICDLFFRFFRVCRFVVLRVFVQ